MAAELAHSQVQSVKVHCSWVQCDSISCLVISAVISAFWISVSYHIVLVACGALSTDKSMLQNNCPLNLPTQPCYYPLNLAAAHSTLLLFVVRALWFAGADVCICSRSFQALRHLHALLPCKLLITEKSAAGCAAVIKQFWPSLWYQGIATSCIADLQQNSHIWPIRKMLQLVSCIVSRIVAGKTCLFSTVI